MTRVEAGASSLLVPDIPKHATPARETLGAAAFKFQVSDARGWPVDNGMANGTVDSVYKSRPHMSQVVWVDDQIHSRTKSGGEGEVQQSPSCM